MRRGQPFQESEPVCPLQLLEQQSNHAVAAQAEIPDQIFIGMHIVGDEARLTHLEDFAGMMQQMAPMFAGMRLTLMVMVDGDIKETNASYRSGKKANLLTVMDVPMDKMLANPQAMKIMANDKDPDQYKKIDALKIEGVKMGDADKTITIKF